MRCSPLLLGAQLAVDVTLRCPFARTGELHVRAMHVQARHDRNRAPRTDQLRKMQVGGCGDRDRWQMERRSGGIHQTAPGREGSRSASVQPPWGGNATGPGSSPPRAPCRLRPPPYNLRTAAPRGVGQAASHHLLLSCSDRIRAVLYPDTACRNHWQHWTAREHWTDARPVSPTSRRFGSKGGGGTTQVN